MDITTLVKQAEAINRQVEELNKRNESQQIKKDYLKEEIKKEIDKYNQVNGGVLDPNSPTLGQDIIKVLEEQAAEVQKQTTFLAEVLKAEAEKNKEKLEELLNISLESEEIKMPDLKPISEIENQTEVPLKAEEASVSEPSNVTDEDPLGVLNKEEVVPIINTTNEKQDYSDLFNSLTEEIIETTTEEKQPIKEEVNLDDILSKQKAPEGTIKLEDVESSSNDITIDIPSTEGISIEIPDLKEEEKLQVETNTIDELENDILNVADINF